MQAPMPVSKQPVHAEAEILPTRKNEVIDKAQPPAAKRRAEHSRRLYVDSAGSGIPGRMAVCEQEIARAPRLGALHQIADGEQQPILLTL